MRLREWIRVALRAHRHTLRARGAQLLYVVDERRVGHAEPEERLSVPGVLRGDDLAGVFDGETPAGHRCEALGVEHRLGCEEIVERRTDPEVFVDGEGERLGARERGLLVELERIDL